MSARDMVKDLAAEAARAQARETELLARVAELEAANAHQDALLKRMAPVLQKTAAKLRETEQQECFARLERDGWKRTAQSVSPN